MPALAGGEGRHGSPAGERVTPSRCRAPGFPLPAPLSHSPAQGDG